MQNYSGTPGLTHISYSGQTHSAYPVQDYPKWEEVSVCNRYVCLLHDGMLTFLLADLIGKIVQFGISRILDELLRASQLPCFLFSDCASPSASPPQQFFIRSRILIPTCPLKFSFSNEIKETRRRTVHNGGAFNHLCHSTGPEAHVSRYMELNN